MFGFVSCVPFFPDLIGSCPRRDRRSIASSVPSGVLVGATEGLTYVDTKGDGRYILANGKDQAMRLWDLRKMRTWGEIQDAPDAKVEYGLRQWDYR